MQMDTQNNRHIHFPDGTLTVKVDRLKMQTCIDGLATLFRKMHLTRKIEFSVSIRYPC